MKKLTLLKLCAMSVFVVSTADADPLTVQNTVAKALGDFYIQVVTLQTQVNEQQEKMKGMEIELDKCHKDGCKIDPPKVDIPPTPEPSK